MRFDSIPFLKSILKEKKDPEFWIVLSLDHPSVMEFIREDELPKFEDTMGTYIRLKKFPTKGEAVDEAMVMMEKALEYDADIDHIKPTLVKLYAEEKTETAEI